MKDSERMRDLRARLGLFLAAVLTAVSLSAVALAQGAIQQSGPVTAFHLGSWYGNGVLGDAGSPSVPFVSSEGLFNGSSCPFGVSSQTGPGSSASPHALFSICQTGTATTFNFQGVNGQSAPSVYFDIGGVTYPFPGSITPYSGAVTFEQFGAVGNGIADDTVAVQTAMGVAGRRITCQPGATYLVSFGIVPAADVYLAGQCRIEAKVGPGGFDSVELAAGRYSTAQCLLCYINVDGGGFENLEIFASAAPGNGGDYVVLPVAINSGMATKPFRGGSLYIHDMTLMTGGFAMNSVGSAGVSLGLLLEENYGTDKTGTWWTYNGVPAVSGQMNPTGWFVDGDISGFGGAHSSRFVFGVMRGVNGFVGPDFRALYGEQIDFGTLSGGTASIGGSIEGIDYDGQGEPLDVQMSHVKVGWMRVKNAQTPLKFGHGASFNDVGPLYVLNSSLNAVSYYGDAGSVNTTANHVGPIAGEHVAERSELTGTLVSATSSTAVLPSTALAINSYYAAGMVIDITSGTGSGEEGIITGYVGSTRTLSIFGTWSVTPDGTSGFTILGAQNRMTVLVANEGGGLVQENTTEVGFVLNGGLRKNDVYSNLTTTTDNNRVVLTADAGGTVSTVSALADGAVRVSPGPNLRAETRLGIASTQTFTDGGSGSTQTLNFGTVLLDTYPRTGVTNPQSDTADLGIRVLTPGVKHWVLSVSFGSGGSAPVVGDIFRLTLLRNGSAVKTQQFVVSTAEDSAGISWAFDLEHMSTWFGGNQNLYTAQLFYGSGGSGSITVIQDPLGSTFSVAD